MRTLLVFSIVLALCAALFFVAPHHRSRDNPFHPRTLAGLYWDLFGDIPELLERGKIGFLLLALAGIATCFYPALMVLMVRFVTAGDQRRGGGMFVLAGLVVLAGAMANFIAMLVSGMTFGFGVSNSKDQTVFIALIPLFQIAFALASIAIGVSATCANWAHRMVVAV
jgi:hypothetical protein